MSRLRVCCPTCTIFDEALNCERHEGCRQGGAVASRLRSDNRSERTFGGCLEDLLLLGEGGDIYGGDIGGHDD